MFTVFVDLTVREDLVEEFVTGIGVNAAASLRDEPGCLRFDVHRSTERPNEFLLYELYSDEDAFYIAHRESPHYAEWQRVAAKCVAPGGHVNTFAQPVFPEAIPEARMDST